MKRDFHVYLTSDAGGSCLTMVMDLNDPAKADILKTMSQTFNKSGRSREADECLRAIGWRAE